jgi:thymidylate synthase
MIREVERDLFEMGIRCHTETMQDKNIADDPSFETKEIMGYSFRIVDGGDKDAMLEFRGLDLKWAIREFAERVSPEWINPGSAWTLRGGVWEEFLKKGEGRFSYTYCERFRTQLPMIIEELKKHPNTRQAVMTIYEGPLDVPKLGVFRVPCSLSYQFLIREGKLHIIYVMRSTDLMTHFPYDVWLAITMMEHVAQKIGVKSGSFTMFAGSLHLYKKDVEGRNIF